MVETLSQLFLNTVKTYIKDSLLTAKIEGRYVPLSTGEFARRVKHLSLGLADLGLGPGDKLDIFSENRPECEKPPRQLGAARSRVSGKYLK